MERAERGGTSVGTHAAGTRGLDVRPVTAAATVTFTTPRHAFALELAVDPRFGPRRPADLLVELAVEAPGGDPVLRAGAGFDLRSPEALLRDLGVDGMTDAEAVRAIAAFVHRAIHHATVTGKTPAGGPWLQWRHRPPRPGRPARAERLDWFGLVRSVGAGLCGRQTGIAHGLFRAAGLPSRVWRLKAPRGGPATGHVVNEVFFDGGWHHLDVSYRGVYLNRHGAIASMEELAADRHLIDRDPAYADEEVDHWALDVSKEACHELLVSYYTSPETNTLAPDFAPDPAPDSAPDPAPDPAPDSAPDSASDSAPDSAPAGRPSPPPLRRGERRTYSWHAAPSRWRDVVGVNADVARRDPYHAAATQRGAFGEIAHAWTVDLAAAPDEAHALEGLDVAGADAPGARLVKPAGRAEGRVVYRLPAPRLHTSLRIAGALDLPASAAAELALSFDRGRSFAPAAPLVDGPFAVDLDEAVAARPDVAFGIRLTGAGAAALRALDIRVAELANPRGFPRLAPGTNDVTYEDGGPPGPRTVRCTYATDVGLAFTPEAPRSGATVAITARVRNGGGEAARNVPVELRLDDPFDGPLIAARTVADVPAHGAAEIDATWDTAGRFGAFDVVLVVDPAAARREPDRLVTRRSIVVRRGPWLHVPPSFLRRDGAEIVLTVAAHGDADASDVLVQLFDGPPGVDDAPFDERRLERIERTTHAVVRARPPAGAAEIGARVIMDGWAWTVSERATAPSPPLTTRADFRGEIEPGATAPGATPESLFGGDLSTIARLTPTASTPLAITMTWDDAVAVGRAVVRYGDFGHALPRGTERFEILTDAGWRPLSQRRRIDGGIFSEHWLAPAAGRAVRIVIEGPGRDGGPVEIRDVRLEERAAFGARPWPPATRA